MYDDIMSNNSERDDEGGTTKHNLSARCQYNVTGWVSMWAYDMEPPGNE